MQDVSKDIEEYNPGKKRKVLIVFDDMIADMINNKKINSIVRVNSRRSFIDNPYLFLATHFVYNYTHYQAISVTNIS